MLADDPWQEGLEARLDRLRRAGAVGPMIVVLPDAFTRLGGCQYLASPVVGDYETYLLDELRAVVEARWPIRAHGILGKSSGGFAALYHAMRRPELFEAVACHSGDMNFALSLFPEIPHLMNALVRHGSVEALLAAFDRDPNKRSGQWFSALYVLAMCSVFSPDDAAPLGLGLPFDLERGTLDAATLDRWSAFDPLRMIENQECQAALRRLRVVFIDCGDRDEHFLHFGALAFHRTLLDAGVPHDFSLFPGGHRGTSHRLDVSLPKLYQALRA
ncbi:MAG: esterase [Deltaproteobacteria bacterium]|nr:esterase [Deltaproteobacteria bacterium]